MLVDAVLLTALLAVAGVLVLSLVRGAVRHWHAERAGTAYELPVCYRGAALRGAGAVLVTALTAVAAVAVVSGPEHRTFTSAATGPPAPPPSAAANPAPAAPTTSPATPSPPPSPSPSPSPSSRLLGHPSGGTLHRLEGLSLSPNPSPAEVWLPSTYARRNAADLAFPVVVAYVPGGAAAADLFSAFATQHARGRAHPFIVVVSPDCGRDLRPLLKAVDTRYRTLPGSRNRAVLGLGPTSSCALDTALRRPGDFRAAAALATKSGGRTGGTGHARPSTVRVPAATASGSGKSQLLLGSTSTDLPARADAVRLRAALAPFADTRIVDTVEPSGERRNLFGVAARYLTEQLGGPSRT